MNRFFASFSASWPQTALVFFLVMMTGGAPVWAQETSPAPAAPQAEPTPAPSAPAAPTPVPAAPKAAKAPAKPAVAVTADESVPAAKASLLKTTRNADYTKPISFDPTEGGIILPNPEIVYDLTGSQGRVLRIGNVVLDDKSFVFALRPLVSFNPQLTVVMGRDGAQPALAMRWPSALLKKGSLEMISRTGAVLWRFEITEDLLNKWDARVSSWRTAMRNRNIHARELRAGLFIVNIALDDLEGKGAPFWNQKEIFRFCLTSLDGRAQTRLCSGRFAAETQGRQVTLKRVPSSIEPRVLVMNENAPLRGVIPVPTDAQTGFYADLAGGESYEFIAAPSKLDLVDLSDSARPGVLRVSGFGVRPAEPSVTLNPDRPGAMTSALGFESTIGDTRKFWAAALRVERPYLHFPGDGGGLFRQRFELNAVPRETSRVHLSKRTPTGTYQDGILLRGRKLPQSGISSEQYSVTQDTRDPSLFVWSFRALEAGEINRSYLTVTSEGKSFKAFHELYRGYGKELSARFSGLAAAGSPLFMGELAYNHWFESLLGLENYFVSRQRWGLSGKYFKSLTQMQVNSLRKSDLDVLTLDLKYRFSPGLWGRDESTGLMLTTQNVVFDEIKAPMAGAGFFWARSMPRVFADWLDGIPLLDAPKWVDLEFVYFGSSLNSNIEMGTTYALNFHGQVQWSKTVFGEAGFGHKVYTFRDLEQNKKAALQTFYGTIGLGMRF